MNLASIIALVSAMNVGGSPSVIMVCVDDLRNEAGAFGGPAHTPNIDALAGDALVLTRNYVQQAVCGPTRASIMTSRRTTTLRTVTHGIKCKGSPRSSSCYWRDVAANFSSLPQLFKEKGGYHTASFGKTFDIRTSGLRCDYPYSWSEEPKQCSVAGSTLNNKKEGCKGFARSTHGLYDKATEECGNTTDVEVVTAANAWLKARFMGDQVDDQPFFLAVGFHRPHLPWIVDEASLAANPLPTSKDVPVAPNGVPMVAWTNSSEMLGYSYNRTSAGLPHKGWGPYERGSVEMPLPAAQQNELHQYYRAAVTHTDTRVGELMATVEAVVPQAIRDELIVVLWGDHGWHLGDNGLWGKCTNFEAATKAPMLIKVPGRTDGGIVTNQLTEHLDLMPTLAEVALGIKVPKCPEGGGVDPPVELCTEGLSLTPLMTPGSSGQEPELRDAAYSLWPHPGVGSPRGAPAAPATGTLQFPGAIGFSMVLSDGSRYTEWVNMSYPNGTEGKGPWVPQWNDQRAVEYYRDATNNDNAAINPDAETKATMDALAIRLHKAWGDETM